MMVGVKIRPAHPFPIAHGAKHRMLRECEAALRGCKPVDQLNKPRAIGIEDGGWSASSCRLVQFRNRGCALWPSDGSSKGNDADEAAGDQVAFVAGRHLAHDEEMGIAQVADHLVRIHLAPAPDSIGAEL